MFNMNNNSDKNSQNIWDQMALFNQFTLCNILNGRNNLGTPELRAAVASMSEEQKGDALVFLECNTEELAGLPNGQGMQAVVNVRTLLDYLPTILVSKLSQLKLLVVFVQLLNQTRVNSSKKSALHLTQSLLRTLFRQSLLKAFLNQF